MEDLSFISTYLDVLVLFYTIMEYNEYILYHIVEVIASDGRKVKIANFLLFWEQLELLVGIVGNNRVLVDPKMLVSIA